jgi:ribosome-binding protein aMBF1 (putative translation factor)
MPIHGRTGRQFFAALKRVRVGNVERLRLGPLVRACRLADGVSQRDQAARLRISAQYLADVELGRRRVSDALVDRMAEIYL